MKSLSTEDIEQVLTQAMEDKTVAMVVRILFCQMKHDAPLLTGEWRRAPGVKYAGNDGGYGEVDDSGKRVLKPELLTEIAVNVAPALITKAIAFTI